MRLSLRFLQSSALNTGLAAVAIGSGAVAQAVSVRSAPAPVEVGTEEILQFSDVTQAAGLSSIFTTGNSHTGGMAWLDYNGDLLPDVFVTNGGGLEHFLYRNDGGGMFTDVSELVPKGDLSHEDAGVKFADIDNDGDDDILVVVDNPAQMVAGQPVNPPEGGDNLLYLNDGAGGFTEVGLSHGVVHPLGRRTSCAGFADYDNDGFVDLYLGSWTMYGLPLGVHDDFDRLLHNDGSGIFEDATVSTGADGFGRDALVMQWIDTDFDLYPDIYVGITAHLNAPPLFIPIDIYYRNSGGVSFVDDVPNMPQIGDDAYAAMGMGVGDFDNDGDWDLYISDTYPHPPEPQGNVLYLGDPDGSFSDNVADIYGVSFIDSWGCGFADLNNDRWSDLWIGSMRNTSPETAFLNIDGGYFGEVAISDSSSAVTRGGAAADYDYDGDIDLFFVNQDQDAQLYRNDTVTTLGWIEFKLYGTQTNRSAIGAVIRLTSGGITQMRRVSGGDSAHSQSEAIQHFGTGKDALVDITVQWPSGTLQSFTDLGPGDLYLINETLGLIPENVTDDGVAWDAGGLVLDVAVTCSFGGRSTLQATGLGALTFDAELGAYVGSFSGLGTKPADVTITSARGGVWIIPVP